MCEPDTWWNPPRCLQPWSQSHPPDAKWQNRLWLTSLLFNLTGDVRANWIIMTRVPFCALPGSGCSLWLQSWWDWRYNPGRWCSQTCRRLHQTVCFLPVPPLAQDVSLSAGVEPLDNSYEPSKGTTFVSLTEKVYSKINLTAMPAFSPWCWSPGWPNPICWPGNLWWNMTSALLGDHSPGWSHSLLSLACPLEGRNSAWGPPP